jgi:hypothetical protein
LPSFTICPYFISQNVVDEQANFTFADLMSDSKLSLFKLVNGLLGTLIEYDYG